jgi:hypothetical protein
MAKSGSGKRSRKQRKQERIKSERAREHGLPRRELRRSGSAKRTSRGSESHSAARGRRIADREEGARTEPDGEPARAVELAPPTLIERIRALPNVAKLAAVAVVILVGIWLLAQSRQGAVGARPPAPTPESVAAAPEQRPAAESDIQRPAQGRARPRPSGADTPATRAPVPARPAAAPSPEPSARAGTQVPPKTPAAPPVRRGLAAAAKIAPKGKPAPARAGKLKPASGSSAKRPAALGDDNPY